MKNRSLPAQALVEYALILVLIALALLGALRLSGTTLAQVYCNIAAKIGNSQACQRAYCASDFSSRDGWQTDTGQNLSSNWKFENGLMCNKGTGFIYNTCSMQMSARDYTIHLDGATLNKGDGYGIAFRSTLGKGGKLNGYTFQYDPGYKAFIFRKWVNGKEINPPFAVAPAKNYDWYGEPHDIAIQIQGNTFTAVIDGQPVLTASDSTYTTGGAGLRTWDATQACMDGFRVTPNQP